MGVFVSFEGGEGSGKSTQARLLVSSMASRGYRVELVHEPGGTELGEYLRTWVKATHKPLTPAAELFLFAAARAELVRTVIRPSLRKGVSVIADRYADSTTVYQGLARQLPIDDVNHANAFATDGLMPDLTILLDAEDGAGLRRTRLQASFSTEGQLDTPGRPEDASDRRFEEEGPEFHRRVREGYLELADQHPERWLVTDAEQPVELIADTVWQRVSSLLDRSAKAQTESSGSSASARLPGL